ncbi:single-stranded DNA-binding protein [Candidatus Kapaibacterium sp.]
MSRTLNKAMLIGNVGKEPELKHTPSGIPVATFRLATSETWKDKDGNVQEYTDWHNIVAWRGLADVVCKIVKKGTRVYVEGKIRTRKYDDKNNNRKFFVEILADNILLLDAKKAGRDNGGDDYKSLNFPDSEDENYFDDSYDSEFNANNIRNTDKDYTYTESNDDLLY